MEKVKLGHSAIEVSELCLGTDSFGSKISEEASFQIMDLCSITVAEVMPT